jgi:hypothetical protein
LIAEIVLLPSESKRLIGKAVAGMESVRRAKKEGILVICRGSTCSFVAQELTNTEIDEGGYTAGYVGCRGLSANPKIPAEVIFVNGRIRKDVGLADIVKDLKKGDVIVKGANAIGPDGIAANLIGRQNEKTTGGTVGLFEVLAMSRGVEVIIPVGLEKRIPVSVLVGARKLSSSKVDYSMGMPCGLVPILGTTVTEVEAMKSIADIEVTTISAGGIGGAEGCIVFLLEGKEAEVKKITNVVEGIKGESPVREPV